jgi:ABC-type Zn uptake system ZnuABC Zn-binding protein ZnuA
MKRLLALILPLFLFAAAWSALAQPAALNVVATTTIIADVARSIGGDRITVTTLVPPDSDEHAWQPTPRDAARLAEADLLLVNGAGLELFLGGLLDNAGSVTPVVVSNGITMLPAHEAHADGHVDDHADAKHIGVLGVDMVCDEHDEQEAHSDDEQEAHQDDEHAHGACDPHVWTDPANVMIWADNIAAALAAADPDGAGFYAANADAYKAQLADLDAEIEALLAPVPAARRVLVTNHNFMAYFAHRYGFEVAGVVLGETTLAETAPQQVAALVETIRAEAVPAIFTEVSAAAALAEAVAAEAGDIAVVALYSGALSAPDGPAATYFDYMRYNAQAIADALGG